MAFPEISIARAWFFRRDAKAPLLAGLLAGLLAASVGFFAREALAGEVAQAAGAMQRLLGHPGDPARPLEEKISLGHEALLDWQLKINRTFGHEVRPTRPAPDHPLIGEVRRMVAALPDAVKRLAGRHLVGLYLVENDYGTGTTESVQDAQGRWRHAYTVLNLTVLTRNANDWGSWKEESAFRRSPGHAVRMVLERPADNSREAAIRFIFLHELGHVVGLARGAHGWWDAKSLPPATENSPFVAVSWRKTGQGKMASRWRARQPLLSKLGFYDFEKAPLARHEAEATYRALAQTDFPSLYGATNLFDDFAEAFAIYVHTRLLGKPYRVDVLKNGKLRFSYRSCITSGRCEEKVKALEALLR